jgi:hypothetical protein
VCPDLKDFLSHKTDAKIQWYKVHLYNTMSLKHVLPATEKTHNTHLEDKTSIFIDICTYILKIY